MDHFTQSILARARERQKQLKGGAVEEMKPLNPIEEDTSLYSEKTETKSFNSDAKFIRCSMETKENGGEETNSPQSQSLNIQKENFNMEIKLSSSDNVRVEVEIEERDLLENEEQTKTYGLRTDAKNRLQHLSKIYGNDGDEVETQTITSKSTENKPPIPPKNEEIDPKTPRKGLTKLAALAQNMHEWEDDFKVEKSVLKKRVKSPAPPPPTVGTKAKKYEAPKPPGTASPIKTKPQETAEDNSSNFQWDPKVINNLESQGFQRTTSNSRLVFNYNKENSTKSSNENDKKIHPKLNTIASKIDVFEPKIQSKPHKDPALLSVSERKALFEKNGDKAPMPKDYVTTKFVSPKKIEPPKNKIEIKTNEQMDDNKFKVGGIARKVAELLEKKTTISQEQIENKIREQKQKDINLLVNRFNRKNDEIVDAIETDQLLAKEKKVRIVEEIPQPPPLPTTSGTKEERRSGEKRSKTDSPRVAAVLTDVKRIKVSPHKQGRLYPSLSDIETVTETETEPEEEVDEEERSLTDSSFGDDVNTSFGRDILKAVCKNESGYKRSSTSNDSDLTDILDDSNEDSDKTSTCDDQSNGPTPPKQGRSSLNSSKISESFNYKKYPTPQYKSPLKTLASPPRKSGDLPMYVVDGDSVLPLKHTVSIYRKQQNQASTPTTPIKRIVRQPSTCLEDLDECVDADNLLVKEKIKKLQDEVQIQEKIIAQTSQALNICNNTLEFNGSTEQVEAERVLLLATHRRQGALHEIQRLQVEGTLRPKCGRTKNIPVEEGSLTITNIVLPLKEKYVTALSAAGGKGHHVICLAKCNEQVVPTKLISTVASDTKSVELKIPGTINLKKIFSDFTVKLEVYCLQAREEILPHDVKYHIKKGTPKTTPKKSKQDSCLIRPVKESPGGPQVIRSPTFALMGYVVFSVQAVNKRNWTLNNTPIMSPLEGSINMTIKCDLNISAEHHGFLTMFEDISGFGAWHRRWCYLQGDHLSYWKYPDDERKIPPIGTIHFQQCITKEVGSVSKDICARLHTLLIETERDAQSGDKDTLVMIRKGDKTVVRHLLSADTKQEKLEWCNKINMALTAMRMWGKCQSTV